MPVASLIDMLKPNVASLGYGLFLAVNAAGVWGGVFPFLPLEFQTREIVLWFFLAQSLVFSASYLASAVGVYFFPGPTRKFLVKVASAPYAIGWSCLIAAIYVQDFALPLVTVGGAFLGLGSAGFYMLWQRLFASQDPDTGMRDLVMGFAYAAVMYFALYLIPVAITAYLIPLVFLPLFGLAITLKSRTISLDQPMFEDVPREHPQVYRGIVRAFWRSALSVGIIGFCAGVMRALAVSDPQIGSLVNIMSMAGLLIASLALAFTWYFRNVRLNVVSIYRFAFPFVITSFLLLPILPTGYSRWLAAVLYAVYSVTLMLMMVQCSQIARDRGVNPVFVYGFVGGIVYALHDMGFMSGMFAESLRVMGLSPLAMVALVAVYLLGLMHFVGSGGFNTARGREAGEIEFMALSAQPLPHESASQSPGATYEFDSAEDEAEDCAGLNAEEAHRSKGTPVEDPSSMPPQNAGGNEALAVDRIASQAQLMREAFRLTARETEIMELIARGNTVARIAEMLVVSENTVRTHSKRIYTKLDIHKKQELIDLIDTFRA